MRLSFVLLYGFFQCIYSMDMKEKIWLRNKSKDMFYHAYNSYMKYAYPWDELLPLSCAGRKWYNKTRGDIDDVLGGYSLTLIDSLDMLPIIGDYKLFNNAVQLIISNVHFNRNVNVSVFETTIRVIGGLLSAHQLASKDYIGLIPGYNNELLHLAIDLGNRMIPAFDTPTGIPYHKINLKYGKIQNESPINCPAAAGSLLLEMAMLSRLSKNPIYENLARKSVLALYKRRSSSNLIGTSINIITGEWINTDSSIGSSIDSFYEYLLKYSIMFHDNEWRIMFDTLYSAAEKHLGSHGWYFFKNMYDKSQNHTYRRVSSLSAFWPGMQILNGDLTSAIKTHKKYLMIWEKYHLLPEAVEIYYLKLNEKFSNEYRIIGEIPLILPWGNMYLLRPEFIESTYHLYIATQDDYYLEVGKMVLNDLEKRTKVPCGYASVEDIHNNLLDDRMDSFFLSETLKYLFLIFQNALSNPIIQVYNISGHFSTALYEKDIIFSTEGHIFLLDNYMPYANYKNTGNTFEKVCERFHYKRSTKNICDITSYNDLVLYIENIHGANVVHKIKPSLNVSSMKMYNHVMQSNIDEDSKRRFVAIHVLSNGYISYRLLGINIYTIVNRLFNSRYALLGVLSQEYDDGCHPITPKGSVGIRNRIILTTHNTCPHYIKAKYLEQAGAAGVIAVDSTYNIETAQVVDDVMEDMYFPVLPFNTSLGNINKIFYNNITIPIILISTKDFAFIYRQLSLYHKRSEISVVY